MIVFIMPSEISPLFFGRTLAYLTYFLEELKIPKLLGELVLPSLLVVPVPSAFLSSDEAGFGVLLKIPKLLLVCLGSPPAGCLWLLLFNAN